MFNKNGWRSMVTVMIFNRIFTGHESETNCLFQEWPEWSKMINFYLFDFCWFWLWGTDVLCAKPTTIAYLYHLGMVSIAIYGSKRSPKAAIESIELVSRFYNWEIPWNMPLMNPIPLSRPLLVLSKPKQCFYPHMIWCSNWSTFRCS